MQPEDEDKTLTTQTNILLSTLSDEELSVASDKLIEKNLEAYKELAK